MSSQNRKDLRSLLVAQALGMAIGGPYGLYFLWSNAATTSETQPITVLLLILASIFSSLLYIAFVFAFMVPAFSLFLEAITEGEDDGSGSDVAGDNGGDSRQQGGAAIRGVQGAAQLDNQRGFHTQVDASGSAESPGTA